MKKTLSAGSLLLVVGMLKIWQHTSAPMTLQDYLAFRCGSATASHGESFLSFAGHCWGCPVAAVGGAVIVYSLFQAVSAMTRPARRAVMIRSR